MASLSPIVPPWSSTSENVGTRAVALIEAIKGFLVLLAGSGLLFLIHHDVGRFAAGLVRHSHLNPASHYPRIFIKAAAATTDKRLWFLAAAALLYATVRFIEAYGLWHCRNWAEIFAIGTGAIYLPIECYEIVQRVSAVRITALVMNVLVVALLAYERMRKAKDVAESRVPQALVGSD